MSVPSSSSTKILLLWALAFTSASKLVLPMVIPGCGLPAMVFWRIACHVSMSVRTSKRVLPSICRCSGGCGGPFRIVWKVTSRRKPCDKNRLLTTHSWTMSNLPASCKLLNCGSVFPKREKRINSRGKSVTAYCYAEVPKSAFWRSLFLVWNGLFHT